MVVECVTRRKTLRLTRRDESRLSPTPAIVPLKLALSSSIGVASGIHPFFSPIFPDRIHPNIRCDRCEDYGLGWTAFSRDFRVPTDQCKSGMGVQWFEQS